MISLWNKESREYWRKNFLINNLIKQRDFSTLFELKKNGYEVILVDDNKGLSSNEALNYLDGVEVFIKSPGIPYNTLILEVINRGIELIDEIELAYRYSKGKFKKIDD